MPNITRKVLLNYKGENHIYFKTSGTDARAVGLAIRTLEQDLGLVPGALTNYFKTRPNSWEVFIC